MLATNQINTANNLEVIAPKPGNIGAEIRGLDVKALASGAAEFKTILETIYRHKLVVIRGQDLGSQEYVDFTRKLGTPQIYFQDNYHHPKHPEIFVSSNVNKPGEKIGVKGTGRYWHTDCAFEKKPLSLTSIKPVVLPNSARETYYIDMHQVYKKLPEDLTAIVENATAQHEGQMRYKVQACDIDKSLRELLDWINDEVPPVQHPAIIQHPVTGDKILYINSGFTTKIVGYNYEENQKIMQALFDFIEREEHIHTHRWQEGDVIIWDNRYLNHKACTVPPGEKSKSYRIGIYDDYPFYVGLEK